MNKNFEHFIEPFSAFAIDFKNILESEAPIKSKIVRGNDGTFMTSQLRREIRHRSKLAKICRQDKTPAATLAFHKQRNKCTKLKRESKKSYFIKVTENGGKRFWKTIQKFVSDKGAHGNEEFVLEENGVLIKDSREVSEVFLNYYTHIVEHSTGSPQSIYLYLKQTLSTIY